MISPGLSGGAGGTTGTGAYAMEQLTPAHGCAKATLCPTIDKQSNITIRGSMDVDLSEKKLTTLLNARLHPGKEAS